MPETDHCLKHLHLHSVSFGDWSNLILVVDNSSMESPLFLELLNSPGVEFLVEK